MSSFARKILHFSFDTTLIISVWNANKYVFYKLILIFSQVEQTKEEKSNLFPLDLTYELVTERKKRWVARSRDDMQLPATNKWGAQSIGDCETQFFSFSQL